MSNRIDAKFIDAFKSLTGNEPFPWQTALYERFISSRPNNISKSCNLPTGLGKTPVIAIWLLARQGNLSLPRGLAYVVNRRTVVDQTTEEVKRHKKMRPDLAVSILRGEFVDNREWPTYPSREAVICGTVYMIGSRLLFSGYGIEFKSRPLRAGFLGQDTLILHDETYLEPVFARPVPQSSRPEDIRAAEGTVYLVCASTGEVGVNISADHLVCDRSTFESMAQRFGRVNPFGPRNDMHIDIVYPANFDDKDKRTPELRVTLALLVSLNDVSPASLSKLDPTARFDAFAPWSITLLASDILFDAWSMTSVRGRMPGRRKFEPIFRGNSSCPRLMSGFVPGARRAARSSPRRRPRSPRGGVHERCATGL